MEVRAVNVGDLDLICRHREAMFLESGREASTLRAMTEHFRTWLLPRLRDGSYFGYVLNVYVEPAARRRGLARRLMSLAEAEFARRGVQYAILHSTAQGRSLYDSLSWAATTEMAKRIPA
jgi:ribosomal protein S18 acetylase RimI-like enzyme